MKTDLNREQMMMIVERARQQRSIAAGDATAAAARRSFVWLAKWINRGLQVLLMSPTVSR